MFNWPLSMKETAGVATVGLVLSYAAGKAMNLTANKQAAGLVAGTALYTMGVAIGASRPASGWMK